MIKPSEKLKLDSKGQKVWDASASPTQLIYNKVIDYGLEGHENLPTIMNEENYGELNNFIAYHLDQEQRNFNQRQFESLKSEISSSRNATKPGRSKH